MRVTKYEHAALRIDHDGETLIVDPGSFTAALGDLGTVVGVVITHEHPDHWTSDHLRRIRDAAPDASVYSTAAVAQAADGHHITAVEPGETVNTGAFTLRFFGGDHAVIHSSLPRVRNVGVLVNETLYYPGDSYAVPAGVQVDTLAAPLGAPWLKIGEAMDFVLAGAPRRSFGTHDMTLSEIGRAMHRQRLRWATEEHGGRFFDLDPGDSLDL
ncbi:MBL fold metallo-hydrolase [Microbacterium sp. NPDC058345]|uniref:MBL fold metallo-hydrolase n=1 Tax=Microbacterium sp. NPDC058345 TaxID=3346455 RepID=UPI00366380AC